MRDKLIQQLIVKYRNSGDAEKYRQFNLTSTKHLANTASDIMSTIPPTFGACAMLSAVWAGILRKEYGIPAIVVAGDLKIGTKHVFKCTENIPMKEFSEDAASDVWDGHCWIEIDGCIGDLSLFRTAYSLDHTSRLKQFVESTFGLKKGCLFLPVEEIPKPMEYIPKFVLSDYQVDGLVAGMGYQLNGYKETVYSTHCMKCDNGKNYRESENIPESCPVCGEHKEFSILDLEELTS